MAEVLNIPKLQSGHGKTVVVGMSGGVDSSVTAALLKDLGYRVLGVFMKNWEEKDATGACTSEADYADVIRVCERLDIPYTSVEFVKEYRDQVFAEFLRDYELGYTPNPDILCNREIKFNRFYKKALALGADYVATGHYARNAVNSSGQEYLARAKDENKDQTYFIYTLQQSVLEKVIFPLGMIEKPEVRRIARELDLATQSKKDSTGICFIGERDFTRFLANYLVAKPGKFTTLDGKTVGTHRGAVYYTPGQRRGLGLGGEGDRWYVVGKDMSKNRVIVERGDRHPALYTDSLTANEVHWISGTPPSSSFRAQARMRHRQALQDCTVTVSENGTLHAEFDIPQRAINLRQAVVFYSGDRCWGGGTISGTGPNYHETAKPLPELVGV